MYFYWHKNIVYSINIRDIYITIVSSRSSLPAFMIKEIASNINNLSLLYSFFSVPNDSYTKLKISYPFDSKRPSTLLSTSSQLLRTGSAINIGSESEAGELLKGVNA